MIDTPQSGAPLIELRDTIWHYDESQPLFDAMNVRVERGHIVALRGRSGVGKSTALAGAMGMLPPSSGEILWLGSDFYKLGEDERARVRRENFGIVLQDGGLLTGLTALENVLVPVLRGRATAADRDRAMDSLDLVGLADRASHTPGRLSGGEAQRVAIARALFADPQLLIVDEPTSSLDRAAAQRVIDLLRELASDRRGVLIASHDAAVIEIADIVHDLERAPVLT